MLDGRTDGMAIRAKMPRSLLSNTDKEIVFDGLKKLYRKKVRPAIPDSWNASLALARDIIAAPCGATKGVQDGRAW